MGKKIIYIFFTIFTENTYNRCGIEVFKKRGFQTEVWSLSNIFFPNNKQKNVSYRGELECSYIDSFPMLFNRLRKQKAKDCYFLLNLPTDYRNYKSVLVYTLLGLFRMKYSSYQAGMPMVPKTLEKKNDFHARLSDFLISYTVYKPRYCFMATAKNLPSASLYKKSKKVYIHVLDYDVYLKNAKAKEKQNFVVFIDECLPFHKDYKLLNITNPIRDVDRYFDELCRFFDIIEKKYNTKVIIASHPSSSYENRKDYFNGRLIEYGKTAELIRDCRFAITYFSAATSFPVLYEVPLVLIADDQLLSHVEESSYAKAYSRFFKKQRINVSRPIDESQIDSALTIDEKIYAKYRRLYIKMPGTPEKPFFEVVADYIENKKY